MPERTFTAEEKSFLGGTAYRWIKISSVSYLDTDLTPDLRAELKKRGFEICRKGVYTTEFCKSQTE